MRCVCLLKWEGKVQSFSSLVLKCSNCHVICSCLEEAILNSDSTVCTGYNIPLAKSRRGGRDWKSLSINQLVLLLMSILFDFLSSGLSHIHFELMI